MREMLARLRTFDRGSSTKHAYGLFVGVTTVFVAYLCVRWPRIEIYYPDSQSYIDWASERPLLYPLLLSTWRAITGSESSIIYLQLALVSAAITFLAAELYRALGSRLAGVLLIAATLSQAFLMDQVFAVLSEGLFLAAALTATALVLRSLRRRRLSPIAWLSLVIGLAIATRSAGYALTLFLAVALVTLRPAAALWKRSLAAFAPVVAVLVVHALAATVVHTGQPRSPGKHSLFGKVAFIEPTGTSPSREQVTSLLATRLATARDIDKDIDELALRWLFRSPIYDHLRYTISPKLIARLSRDSAVAEDEIRGDVAFALIREHPGDYAYDVALNVYAMWSAPGLQRRATASRYNAFLEEAAARAVPENSARSFAGGKGPLMYLVGKGLRLAAFVASLFLVACAIGTWIRHRRVPTALVGGALVALVVHGYSLLIALVQSALPRYAIMLWPLWWVIVLVAGLWILGWGRSSETSSELGQGP